MNTTTPINPTIHESWKTALKDEFSKPYFAEIKRKLLEEKGQGQIHYPPGPQVFNAFNQTPFEEIKVVILGQDPYHGPRQAHGMCFSVAAGVPAPPSLVNIFKEIHNDLGHSIPNHGNLEKWAKQGVFLLNAMLTVKARQPASHQNIGWQNFTDAVIKRLSDARSGLVFLLWGRYAQNKSELIDNLKHHVLMAPHPSPFSADRGFFGCKHFSKANEILQEQGKDAIDWEL
jgi:uracil-DNA glycosylase